MVFHFISLLIIGRECLEEQKRSNKQKKSTNFHRNLQRIEGTSSKVLAGLPFADIRIVSRYWNIRLQHFQEIYLVTCCFPFDRCALLNVNTRRTLTNTLHSVRFITKRNNLIFYYILTQTHTKTFIYIQYILKTDNKKHQS